MANIVSIIIKGVDQTSAGFKTAIRGMDDITKAAGALATTLQAGAVAGATALAALTARAINNAEEMHNLAQKAGMGTLAFSKLAHAAKIANVESGTLQTGIRNLNNSIVEAATKADSDAAKAFARLGVSAVDANGKIRDTRDVLLDLATAFARYEDGAAKSAAAGDIFGKKLGSEMIPLLNESRASIEALEATTSGVTAKMGAESDAFHDNLTKLRGAIGDIGRGIASQILPQLVQWTDALAKWAATGNAANRTAAIMVDVMQRMAVAVAFIKTLFAEAGIIIGHLFAGAFEIASRVLDTWNKNLQVVKDSIVALARSLWGIIKAVAEVGTVLGKLSAGDFKGAAESAKAAALTIGGELKAMLETVGGGIKGAFTNTITNAAGAFEHLQSVAKSALREIAAEAEGFGNFAAGVFSAGTGAAGSSAAATGEPGRAPFPTAPTGPGMSYYMGGSEDRSLNDYIKQRTEAMERLAELHRTMRLETLADFEREREEAKNTYDQRIASLESLKLFEDEFRAGSQAAWQAYEAKLTAIKKAEADKQKQIEQAKVSAIQMSLGNMASAMLVFGKKGFAAYKAFAVAEAIVATYEGATKALAKVEIWPFNNILAASIIASGMANVARIIATEPAGQAHGGLGFVPEESTYALQRGERVLSPRQNQDLTDFLSGGRAVQDAGRGQMSVAIYLDGTALARGLGEMSRDGRLVLDARAIA